MLINENFVALSNFLFANRCRLQEWEPEQSLETWRTTLELEFDAYTLTHYKHGTCNVFAKKQDSTTVLIGCIEDHQFQPQNYWYRILCL